MNFFSTYARILPRTLLDRQVRTCLNSGILKTLNCHKLTTLVQSSRLISLSSVNREEEAAPAEEVFEVKADKKRLRQIAGDPSKDRRVKIPVETSIRYMKSSAYKQCYGEDPVWKHYRRNHKGGRAPKKTRKMCIRAGVVASGNPCPVCRDAYLVVDHKNIDLLKQFISSNNGEIISYTVTGVCQQQHDLLIRAFHKAKELGTITYDVPFRKYDYSEYTESL